MHVNVYKRNNWLTIGNYDNKNHLINCLIKDGYFDKQYDKLELTKNKFTESYIATIN